MKEKYGFENFTAGMKLATMAAFTLLVGMGGTAIWKASAQSERLDTVITTVNAHEQKLESIKDTNYRVIRLESDVSYIKKAQDDMRSDLKEILKEVKKP